MTARPATSFLKPALLALALAGPLSACGTATVTMPETVAAIDADARSPANGWLWQATLDVLGFMPIRSQDPATGVIATDWMQPSPALPNEQVRAEVRFLSKELRSDGVRVTLYRQVAAGGGWAPAAVDPAAASRVEYAILTRARQLRVAYGEADE